MDIYVVLHFKGNRPTVIGAATDRDGATTIADRHAHGAWGPWERQPALGRDIRSAASANEDQTITQVPLAGFDDGALALMLGTEVIPASAVRRSEGELVNELVMRQAKSAPTLEQMADVMRTISAMPKPPGRLRCGNGAAWDWLRRGLDQMASYSAEKALPDSIAARVLGIDVVLDPNLPPDVMKLGDKTFVIDGESVLAFDDAALGPMRPYPLTNPPG